MFIIDIDPTHIRRSNLPAHIMPMKWISFSQCVQFSKKCTEQPVVDVPVFQLKMWDKWRLKIVVAIFLRPVESATKPGKVINVRTEEADKGGIRGSEGTAARAKRDGWPALPGRVAGCARGAGRSRETHMSVSGAPGPRRGGGALDPMIPGLNKGCAASLWMQTERLARFVISELLVRLAEMKRCPAR